MEKILAYHGMKIAIIADSFPPLRTSAAVQLHHLAIELERQGHEPWVFVPAAKVLGGLSVEKTLGIHVVRMRTPNPKTHVKILRLLNEALMPFFMLYRFYTKPLRKQYFDGIVWYSPSIFFGPLIYFVKRKSKCRSYLILRDIFPDWAWDVGLLQSKFAFKCLQLISHFQYRVADVIGIQTDGNRTYIPSRVSGGGASVEVLQNWLSLEVGKKCALNISRSPLAGRKIFLYAGNMGLAQAPRILVDLAAALSKHEQIGFVFVGRGSEKKSMEELASTKGLKNVLFFDEIAPEEILDFCRQCHVGIVCLDLRHRTQNIPGKLLTYLAAQLPIIAITSKESDLAQFIKSNNIGEVFSGGSFELLEAAALKLATVKKNRTIWRKNASRVFLEFFSTEAVVKQIVTGLMPYDETLSTDNKENDEDFQKS